MEKLWGKIKKSVVDGVQTAAGKTEEYTRLGKAKLDILAVKRKISKSFTELGGIVYDGVKEKKGADTLKTDEVATLVDTLDALEEELREKEAALEDMTKKEDEDVKDGKE
ncbi:MAG: hypothetical protein J7M24_07015 [Candidatus Latescibacteria bacterium]|nr:hypothetical protein [Candidatus Latescibacterota bacterium]